MSPRRRLPSTRFYVWSFIVLLVAVRVIAATNWRERRTFEDAPLREASCEVVRVVSGNKLIVRQSHLPEPVTVRLLSTQAANEEQDGPSLAQQAMAFTRDFVTRGTVRLRLDQHRLDRQGNYLAYVEVADEQLNEALLDAGLARFIHFPGNSQAMDRRLGDAERAAKSAKLGIWSGSDVAAQ